MPRRIIMSTTREVKVFVGNQTVTHIVASANDKKVLAAEVSKYFRGLTYNQAAVTITKKK